MPEPVLLLTRPADEIARTAALAHAAGFATCAAPLLQIRPLAFRLPDTSPEALLFTSPRAPAAVADAALRCLPAYCVGPRTAAAAQAAGFQAVWQGDSDGNAALGAMAAQGVREVLQLCGRNRIELTVPEGVNLTHVAVYEAVAAELAAAALADLRAGRIFAVTLFSPRTARQFVQQFDRSAIPRANVRLAVLSANVAAAAGSGWRAVAIADRPDASALLAAAARLRGADA